MNQKTLALWATTTICLGSFLLFQIQPIITKFILPTFGSSPTVWVTALFYFQTLLVFGYIYSHYLSKQNLKAQLLIHFCLIICSAQFLPFNSNFSWFQTKQTNEPILQILILLFKSTGLPYFILATTTPLIQSWYTSFSADKQPYKLFSWSNLFSLTALISYPILVEPFYTLNNQSYFWTLLFIIYGIILFSLPILNIKNSPPLDQPLHEVETPTSLRTKTIWLFAPAWATLNLAAITNHLSQDISSVPFIWITPLAIYLITFIQTFKKENNISLNLYAMATTFIIITLCIKEQLDNSIFISFNSILHIKFFSQSIYVEIILFLALLYMICTLCHGILFKHKPVTNKSTVFYIYITTGGCLGTFIVSILCPYIFSTFMELNYALLVNLIIAAIFLIRSNDNRPFIQKYSYHISTCFLALFALTWYTYIYIEPSDNKYEYKRNFFGVLNVTEVKNDTQHFKSMYYGRILHGMQNQKTELKQTPLTYYTAKSGLNLLFQTQKNTKNKKVAILGLGTGTIASFGQTGDFFRFYEINPYAIELCNKHFSYLKDSKANVDIKLGDGRILMSQEDLNHKYNIIVLDAFTGDAIPLHLLTIEAFKQYESHLTLEGIIAINITNKYLDLLPVLIKTAENMQMTIFQIKNNKTEINEYSSNWVFFTKNLNITQDPIIKNRIEKIDLKKSTKQPWSDQKSSLLETIWLK